MNHQTNLESIAGFDDMDAAELRRECIRLARQCNSLTADLQNAEERRDFWFRERESALDEIEELRHKVSAMAPTN